jgi:predicted AAA+ superfamily ATPase
MPHLRKRHALRLFNKRLSFSRVVSIQGSRQSGKSVLARELFARTIGGSEYLTFDQPSLKSFATSNPETFLEQHADAKPLLIDEAQKVPEIFDAIKFRVDRDPRPGQYVLLGSTEFSKEARIREALTGRLSRIRLYSLNLAECLELGAAAGDAASLIQAKPRVSRVQLLKHLERGGFPGIFAVRDAAAHRALLKDWVDLTVQRDLHQFPKIRVDGELAFDALSRLASAEEPSAAAIASDLRRDTRAVQRVLSLLEVLFVVHRLDPHPLSTGKPLYFHCDPALAAYFGASFERQLMTWALHEQLSQRAYRDDRDMRLSFYRNTKGRFVHLLLSPAAAPKSLHAIKIVDHEQFDSRDFEILRALRSRCERQGIEIATSALAATSLHLKADKIRAYPWESLA